MINGVLYPFCLSIDNVPEVRIFVYINRITFDRSVITKHCHVRVQILCLFLVVDWRSNVQIIYFIYSTILSNIQTANWEVLQMHQCPRRIFYDNVPVTCSGTVVWVKMRLWLENPTNRSFYDLQRWSRFLWRIRLYLGRNFSCTLERQLSLITLRSR